MQNHPTSWLSKSIFYVKNYPNLSHFFHWRISIQEHIFCYWHFLITSTFKSLYFLKWCPIFDTSPLTQFSKFHNFLWVCWFLGKNISNFVPTVWKLHNPYCHTRHSESEIENETPLLGYIGSGANIMTKESFTRKMTLIDRLNRKNWLLFWIYSAVPFQKKDVISQFC